jgi:primase-polymerase (primpol)-like protein
MSGTSKDEKTLPTYELIPAQLKEYPQWVVWKREIREGEATKVPYSARTHRRASTIDSRTWTDYEQALEVFQSGNTYDGLGFVFTKDDPFFGIDWDGICDLRLGVIDETIFADEILALGSYAETSPSGTGVHVIVMGSLPGDRKKGGNREMYESGRYFTMTGWHIGGTPATIEKAPQDVLKRVYGKMVGETGSHSPASFHDMQRSQGKPPMVLSLSDEEIIARCLLAKNSPKFRALFERGVSICHKSPSEDDMALCGLLAFYTNDRAQIDRIFRQSRFYQEKSLFYKRKWDRVGADTINKVVRDTNTMAYSVRSNPLTPEWRIPRRVTFTEGMEEDLWQM